MNPHQPLEELHGWPILSKNDLVDLGGWDLLKEARNLLESGAVSGLNWKNQTLSGRVGMGKAAKYTRLRLPSLRNAENSCNCRTGQEGFMCQHAIALGLATQLAIAAARERERLEALEEEAEEQARRKQQEQLVPQSIVLSEAKGKPLDWHYLLPPNLERTAPRDAIAVKVIAQIADTPIAPENINRGHAYRLSEEAAASAWLIEQWCKGKLHGLLQLKRDQLRELVEINLNRPVFFWVNRPTASIPWLDDELAGVSLYLREDTPVIAPANDSPKTQPTPADNKAHDKNIGHSAPSSALPPAESSTGIEVDGSPQYLSITLPSRETYLYAEALDLVKQNGFVLEPRNRKWWLRGQNKTLNFLARYQKELTQRFGATFTDNFRKQTHNLVTSDWNISVRKTQEGFQIDAQLATGGADIADIVRSLSVGQSYIERAGKLYLLEPDKLQRIEKAQRALTGDASQTLTPNFSRSLNAAQLRDVEAILEDCGLPFTPPEEWQRRSAALASIGKLEQAPIDNALNDKLRGYQRIGVAWLWHLYNNGLGGILADEMGLGKTIQALALISAIQPAKDEVRALVVCPAGLVENWLRETSKFTPQLRAHAQHGTSRLKNVADFSHYDIIVTSYQTARRDHDLLTKQPFSLILGDEAQHIKNRRSQAAATLRALVGRGRFLLTGTPVENSLDDLRALFDFILPGYLARIPGGNLDRHTRDWYHARHRQQAAPYILRRSKQLVAPELPQKLEQVVYCRMEREQQRLYQEYQVQTEREIMELQLGKASEAKLRMAAFTQLLRLRQICVDPRLVNSNAKPAHSAKLAAFTEILDEALDAGRRMLVFSQFTSALTLIAEQLQTLTIPYLYLDGQTKNRASLSEQFNQDATIPVFLISLKAGGTGLNLTGADMVIHYDPWWNPAIEAQATDRAHRIGQTRQVDSIKLITAGTIEEKVLSLQHEKANLLRDILEASETTNAKIGLKEMLELLA